MIFLKLENLKKNQKIGKIKTKINFIVIFNKPEPFFFYFKHNEIKKKIIKNLIKIFNKKKNIFFHSSKLKKTKEYKKK